MQELWSSERRGIFSSVKNENVFEPVACSDRLLKPEGDISKGHSDIVISYISGDNRAYIGNFAEWYDE